jgi:hypothetical protein
MGDRARMKPGVSTTVGTCAHNELHPPDPRPQLRPVDGEVLRGDVAAQLGLADDRDEELVRDLMLQRRLRFFVNMVASNAS